MGSSGCGECVWKAVYSYVFGCVHCLHYNSCSTRGPVAHLLQQQPVVVVCEPQALLQLTLSVFHACGLNFPAFDLDLDPV